MANKSTSTLPERVYKVLMDLFQKLDYHNYRELGISKLLIKHNVNGSYTSFIQKSKLLEIRLDDKKKTAIWAPQREPTMNDATDIVNAYRAWDAAKHRNKRNSGDGTTTKQVKPLPATIKGNLRPLNAKIIHNPGTIYTALLTAYNETKDYTVFGTDPYTRKHQFPAEIWDNIKHLGFIETHQNGYRWLQQPTTTLPRYYF